MTGAGQVADLRLPRTRADIAAIQAARKPEAVRRAMRSAFFRGRLDHLDLDRLDRPEEWARVPILDKDMLRELSDAEFYDGFCVTPDDGDAVSEFWRSGGTTGRPLFYPRTHRDLGAAMTGFSRVFACAGTPPAARAHCSFPLGIHPVGQMTVRAAERLGMSMLMAGAGTTTPSLLQLELIERLMPSVWIGMSSYGLHLANLADQQGRDLAAGPVDLMICSAEPLSAAKREKLGRLWGAKVRDTFGMTEAGMMAAEDGVVDGFRVWSDLFHVEVVDPGTREPVPDGTVGALVVTPLFTNNCTPFLRWLSGDLVTMHREVDGDGPFSVFPVVRHAHRTSGFFKIRGINISHGEFEDFVFRDATVNDFKCEAVTVGDLDVLRVFVELKRDVEPAPALKRIAADIKRVFELTPEVELLPAGTLAKEFEAAIKAPRIVDRRG
ncbi:MAG: AMP-binding protein [Thalassobaculum sp.]|uniref:phenylacetate--CoA ligase family protein n=1 Tax=Thalassobaculum sp. TaxID=2022740 RepID=UPI0032ECF1AF